MTRRIVLALITTLVFGFLVGGTIGWRVAEYHILATAEALIASASAERAMHLLSVVDALDSGSVGAARQILVRRINAELATAGDCARKPECSARLAESASSFKQALERASQLK
jgi:hypothetical protein